MIKIENHGSLVLLREEIPPETLEYISGALTFTNQEYFARKAATGRRPRGISTKVKAFWGTPKRVTLPRAFLGPFVAHLNDLDIDHEIADHRVFFESVSFEDSIEFRPGQGEAIDAVIAAGPSVLVAPPGSGKTVMGLKIVALSGQPALILVHRKQLMEQWLERAQTFLGLDKKEIGIIGGGRDRIGNKLTIGMLQSVSNRARLKKIGRSFGLVLVDECHHIPARTFLKTVKGLEAGLIFGLTATPFRKYRDERLIFLNIGPVAATMTGAGAGSSDAPVDVTVLETRFTSARVPKKEGFEPMAREIIADGARNGLITGTVLSEAAEGRKVMVITERVEHVETLARQAEAGGCPDGRRPDCGLRGVRPKSFEEEDDGAKISANLCAPKAALPPLRVVSVTGTSDKAARAAAMARIGSRDYDVIVTTGQFMGEGTDLPDLDTLVLAFPFSFEGKLVQNLGRIQRASGEKRIFDFRDRGCGYLEGLYRKRRRFYRKLAAAGGSLKEIPAP